MGKRFSTACLETNLLPRGNGFGLEPLERLERLEPENRGLICIYPLKRLQPWKANGAYTS